ncbi:HNH endonuclease [Streptomyces kaniharaensis]|uniref:HNH endonuclease n=1 Tax=Streptomyces kaniharaensis TaxID=212423 RepID=A0A6N7L6X8_9ACTN|nr:HNH endonuclease [Streptomyces kaniharaensis]MQS18040.1 HNH endonuclease [Streptomyces kaniharaensis]
MPWAELVGHAPSRARYTAKVFRRGDGQCWYWTGGISSTGHGKFRAGTGDWSEVVSAHEYGYAVEHGHQALIDTPVIRHTCDSPSCCNPRHWLPGTRQDNVLDYASRSRLAGHALADVRGPRGRADAIREAILAAKPDEVEAAIREAIRAGQPGGAQQDGLWEV